VNKKENNKTLSEPEEDLVQKTEENHTVLSESEPAEPLLDKDAPAREAEEEDMFLLEESGEESLAEPDGEGQETESTGEEQAADNAGEPTGKKEMSRGKKIALIVGCVILSLLLIISIVGTILFFHYYGKLNYKDRDDTGITADVCALKLEDIHTRELYTFQVDVTKLNEEDANLIVSWYSKNWTLILEVGKDPKGMTAAEYDALLARVLAAIRKESERPEANVIKLTVLDAATGTEKVITVELALVKNAEDVAVLAEYEEGHSQKALWYGDSDMSGADDETRSELYAKLAQAVRDLERTVANVRLKDQASGKTLLVAIYRGEIDDTGLADILKWKDTVSVSSLVADPTALTEEQRSALVSEVVLVIRDSMIARYTLKLRDVATGELYEFVLKQTELEQGQLKPISAQIQKGELAIELTSDPALLDEAGRKALILRIVEQILAGNAVDTREILIKNITDGTEYILTVREDEITAEQWTKLLKPSKGTVFNLALAKDPAQMSKDERGELLETVISLIDNMDIQRHTLSLRDLNSNQLYLFEIAEAEVSAEQLTAILRQISRGELTLSVGGDPATLDAAGRAALIERVLQAIEKLEKPGVCYPITLVDRKSGKRYSFELAEDEITEEQLGLLLSLGVEATLTMDVAADPATMTDAQKKALAAAIFEEIEHPTRTLVLTDTATQKNYHLYFRDKDVTVEQLSYLMKQIDGGTALKIKIEKDPSVMTAAEKAAFIEKVVEAIKTPVVKEYTIQLRDKDSGLGYALIFTKEEVNDASLFGYLLIQAKRGTVLNCSVTKEPANMTAAERKALFAAVAELVKNPPKEEDDPEALEKLKEHLENMAQNPVKHTDDIYNVLLVGTDERKVDDPTKAKNSDTMILVTINYKDGTITLTSLMRDTGVEYTYVSGGVERTITSKLNSAHAVGGIKTLIAAIEKNYGVKIDNYVKVNWFSFVDIFKVLGGIEVNVNAKHLEKLNLTILDSCVSLGVDYESRKLTEGGYQHLDPYQTLAYVRYRVDDADFGRTARQREVLSILFEKFKRSSFGKINDILNTVLPLLTTDLTEGNCASLLLDFPFIIGYKLQQVRLPEWQEYTSYKGMLMPDWPKTLKRFYKNAYGSLCPAQYK